MASVAIRDVEASRNVSFGSNASVGECTRHVTLTLDSRRIAASQQTNAMGHSRTKKDVALNNLMR